MNNCITNKCKVLDYEGECAVYSEIDKKHIANNCPCLNCIVRPVCNVMCNDRREYALNLLTPPYKDKIWSNSKETDSMHIWVNGRVFYEDRK